MFTKLQTASRRWAVILVLLVAGVSRGYAQYTEAALVAAITANSIALGDEISRTNNLQSATLGQNTIIAGLLDNILDYEKKMYNYLSEAQSAVTSAYTIVRCINLGGDIVSELAACSREAVDHPQGLLVSSMLTSQYSDIVQEASALVAYIAPVVKASGDNNLLNSAERLRILNSVSSRLYNLYAAVCRMKQNIMRMRWAHLVRTVSPELYRDFMDTGSAYDKSVTRINQAIRRLD